MQSTADLPGARGETCVKLGASLPVSGTRVLLLRKLVDIESHDPEVMIVGKTSLRFNLPSSGEFR